MTAPSVATFASQRSLTASAGASQVNVHAERHDPSTIAATLLTQALADRSYRFVLTERFHSLTNWMAVGEFVTTAIGAPEYEAVGPVSGLYAASSSEAVAVEYKWGDTFDVTVAASDKKTATKLMDGFAVLLPVPPPPPPLPPRPDNVLSLTFWAQDPMYGGATSRRRDVNVHRWAEVQANYPSTTRESLSTLIDSTPDAIDGSGKLVLLHGPPGTGKTRLVLTILSEWREWAAASVVTDADKFFGDATYMNDLVFGIAGMKDWLVLVIEDGDEYLNVGAASTKGQAISRLLNVNDGILGQGINLLTIMSTNIPSDQVNPAVRRPGRCLADLHLGAFPPDEAAAWCAEHGVDAEFNDSATLAELYARLR